MTLRSESGKNRFPHNRKRNTGLLYEFLVRNMAHQAIEHDREGWKKSFNIVRNYFSPNSPLAKELELFDAVRSCRGMRESSARQVLREVVVHAKAMDQRKLEIKKSNLIKEINYTFGKDFFSKHRIPEYRLLASIHLLIEGSRVQGRLLEGVQRIQLEEAIMSYMMSIPMKQEDVIPEVIDGFVYSIAEERFEKKYGSTLSSTQRKLLEGFAVSMLSGDKKQLREHLLEEKVRMLSVLRSARTMQEVRSDEVMRARLEEAIVKLSSLNEGADPECVVEEMLLFERLTEELTNDV
jgi:hypothetical protein